MASSCFSNLLDKRPVTALVPVEHALATIVYLIAPPSAIPRCTMRKVES